MIPKGILCLFFSSPVYMWVSVTSVFFPSVRLTFKILCDLKGHQRLHSAALDVDKWKANSFLTLSTAFLCVYICREWKDKMSTHIAAQFLLGRWLSEPSLTHHLFHSTHFEDTHPSAQLSHSVQWWGSRSLIRPPVQWSRICLLGFPAVSFSQSGVRWKVGQAVVGSDDGGNFSHACNFT